MPVSSAAWTLYEYLPVVFLSLLASLLNFFSLDYQQCNWVRELCGPAAAAKAGFRFSSIETHCTTIECQQNHTSTHTRTHTQNWFYKFYTHS